jgi:hypothetical protein
MAIDGRLAVADTGNHAVRLFNMSDLSAGVRVLSCARVLSARRQRKRPAKSAPRVSPTAPLRCGSLLIHAARRSRSTLVRQTAAFALPRGVAIHQSSGVVYIADTDNHRIRAWSTASGTVRQRAAAAPSAHRPHLAVRATQVSTIAGSGSPGFLDGAVAPARFWYPWRIALLGNDGLLVADSLNHRVRLLNLTTLVVSTVAGNGTMGVTDGQPGQLSFPLDLTVQGSLVYVSQRACVRQLDSATWTLTTVVGNCSSMAGDASATLGTPSGLYIDANGLLYITDEASASLVVAPVASGAVTRIAGRVLSTWQTGNALIATFLRPTALAGYQHAPLSFNVTLLIADADADAILVSTALCPQDCIHGQCVSTTVCNCTTGYNGNACQLPICSPPCVGGQLCLAPNVCSCPAGYQGPPACTTPICGACTHGTCTSPGVCTCQPGWSGAACDQPVCTPNCVNGTCVSAFTCACNTGWSGVACDTPVCACQHGGACILPGVCNCTSSYTGADCSVPVCDPPCLSSGSACVAPNVCACSASYTGPTCSVGHRAAPLARLLG